MDCFQKQFVCLVLSTYPGKFTRGCWCHNWHRFEEEQVTHTIRLYFGLLLLFFIINWVIIVDDLGKITHYVLLTVICNAFNHIAQSEYRKEILWISSAFACGEMLR